MNKSRLEAYTDAVIAIAATLMVLELNIPDHVTLAALAANWSTFFAYIISFFLLYVTWYAHHNAFLVAKVITPRVFMMNGVWLFVLTLIPFATKWVGDDPNAVLPEVIYLVTRLALIGAFQVMTVQLSRDNPDAKATLTSASATRWILITGIIISCVFAVIIPIVSLFTIAIVTLISSVRVITVDSRNLR